MLGPSRRIVTAVGVLLLLAAPWSSRGFARQAAGAAAPAAQAPAQAPAAVTPAQAENVPPSVFDAADGGRIRLIAGRSIVMTTEYDVKRIAITNPAVADVTTVSPRELLIDGKAPGTISLIVWGDTRRVHYELVVEPSVTTLEQRLRELFPGEQIRVTVSEGAVILSGQVSTNQIMLKAAEIAGLSLPQQKVINMLQVPGGEGSQQVMLQVRFGEVNRKAVDELGINLFTTRSAFTARSTTQQFPAPEFDDVNGGVSGLTFSDFLNIFFFQRNQGIGGVLRALKQNGNFESLAEPNLIAYNGVQAQFLAGGEIPIPQVSGNSGNVSVSYKEFGIRLTFKPTIAGDVIRLHVRPEVSSLDFANGVTLNGFRIPALTTRYAETEVELRDGQSFAIAGLMDHVDQVDRAWIPILSQIPIIGNLFKTRAKRSDQTELLVIITPRLVRPLNPDEVPPMPTMETPVSALPGSGVGLTDAPAPAGR